MIYTSTLGLLQAVGNCTELFIGLESRFEYLRHWRKYSTSPGSKVCGRSWVIENGKIHSDQRCWHNNKKQIGLSSFWNDFRNINTKVKRWRKENAWPIWYVRLSYAKHSKSKDGKKANKFNIFRDSLCVNLDNWGN